MAKVHLPILFYSDLLVKPDFLSDIIGYFEKPILKILTGFKYRNIE